jgi:hypothetical protein
MKYLQTFSLFESRTPGTLTPEQEAFLNLYTKGTWSVNSSTGLVDVQGLFHCSGHGLKSLGGIRFGTVTGNFDCRTNQLTTLEGAPRTVEGNFWCNWNQLTTLEGAPRTVEGNFDCYSNKLTTLEGAPRTVGGNFVCHDNKLTTLEGAPRTVEGNFDCYSNKLTTLEGAPQKVGGDFDCYSKKLTTLEGAPQTVTRYFRCYDFTLNPGEWNPTGWLQVLQEGSPKAQKLIQTLPYLQPDWWNSELSKDPARTIQLLAPWWSQMSDELKRGIRIPPGYEDRFEMRSELSDLGLF